MPSNRPLVAAINNDAAFLHLLEALLHEERYETLLLQTGDIALDSTKKNRPKLIICSVADQTLAARNERLDTAGCQIIEKPFNLNDLLTTIQGLLDKQGSSFEST